MLVAWPNERSLAYHACFAIGKLASAAGDSHGVGAKAASDTDVMAAQMRNREARSIAITAT